MMKAIPYIIFTLVGITLLANGLLLVSPAVAKRYFLWADLLTGIMLITTLILVLVSKKSLKKQHGRFIHRIFSKN